MAVSSVTIVQDNKEGNVDLFAVSSPLVFLIEVEYTLSKPSALAVIVKDKDDVTLGTFQAIEYLFESGKVTYRFVASDMMDAYISDFDDVFTAVNDLEYIPVNRIITLEFSAEAVTASVTFDALHAAAQFGETPALVDIYNNTNLVFHGCIDEPVYVYFYNNSESNNLVLDNPSGTDDACLDNDDVVFLDSDDYVFRAL